MKEPEQHNQETRLAAKRELRILDRFRIKYGMTFIFVTLSFQPAFSLAIPGFPLSFLRRQESIPVEFLSRP